MFKMQAKRSKRYTPATTIVAACIKAETGVGPSIASGSQPCKNIWADLVITPIKKNKQITSPHLKLVVDHNSRFLKKKSSDPVKFGYSWMVLVCEVASKYILENSKE